MPRRKKDAAPVPAPELPQSRDLPPEVVSDSQALAISPTASVMSESAPLTTAQRQELRDDFEGEAAKLLAEVRSTLQELLSEGNPKERLAAAKLLLQVNGLLEKRQVMDAESVGQLIGSIMQRTPMQIRTVEGSYTTVDPEG